MEMGQDEGLCSPFARLLKAVQPFLVEDTEETESVGEGETPTIRAKGEKKKTPHTHSQKRENTVGPNPPAVGLSFCISQVCVCGWGWLITLGRLILNPYAWRRAPEQ